MTTCAIENRPFGGFVCWKNIPGKRAWSNHFDQITLKERKIEPVDQRSKRKFQVWIIALNILTTQSPRGGSWEKKKRFFFSEIDHKICPPWHKSWQNQLHPPKIYIRIYCICFCAIVYLSPLSLLIEPLKEEVCDFFNSSINCVANTVQNLPNCLRNNFGSYLYTQYRNLILYNHSNGPQWFWLRHNSSDHFVIKLIIIISPTFRMDTWTESLISSTAMLPELSMSKIRNAQLTSSLNLLFSF